jgi:hypothetical protein
VPNPIRLALLQERTTFRDGPRGSGQPEWTWEDYAHAAGATHCSDLEIAALEYRWRQAGKCRHALYGALMLEALKAERRHRWSERLFGHRYMDAMAHLALDVEANPRLDGLVPLVAPDGSDERGRPQYKRYPGWWCLRLPWMTEAQWRKEGETRYTVIRAPLDMWAGEAVRKIKKYLGPIDF